MKYFLVIAVIILLLASYSNGDPESDLIKPNILIILADDMRPDLGAYGDTLAVTPNLDQLAREGLVFNRAYCQKAVCWPSRNSFFSGLMPASLGSKTNAFTTFRSQHPGIVALPQLFKNHGWYTRGFGKILHNGQDDPVSWSAPYFEPEPVHYAAPENLGKHPIINKAVPENRLNPVFESADVADEAYEDGLTAKAARQAIREAADREEPFFMMVGFHKPHTPFNAPKKYWDLYKREEIPLAKYPYPPINAPEKFAVHPWRYFRSFKDMPQEGPMPDFQARELKHAYYACISYVDALVGGLLEELEAVGQKDNTIIVFTSDHGYQLGDHSLWSKHTNFELATRVPLFVSIPGSASGKSDSLVELLDLYPTLADLAGLDQPDHLEGESFKNTIFDPQAPARFWAFSEYTRNGARGCSIRTDQFRYVEWRNQKSGEVVARELYDHRADPGENVNVAGDSGFSATIAELSRQLGLRL
jgi:iduronate 2-sulfatase